MDVIGMASAKEWDKIVEASVNYDVYHLSSYHALAELNGEGTPFLFVTQAGRDFIALPLLLRPLDMLPFLSSVACGWRDATSVYGYAGPVFSRPDLPEALLTTFRADLHSQLNELCVVAAFSRLHPLIAQTQIMEHLGDILPTGQTVSIDLTRTPDLQFKSYREAYRRQIRNARLQGITIIRDTGFQYIEPFSGVYLQTMRRVRAANYYHFGNEYFSTLVQQLGNSVHLFVALYEDEVIAGALVLTCGGTLQYHLGGARQEYFHLSPMKLLIDEIRIWGTANAYRCLHLGGGVGGNADSLLHFKAGFSDSRHEFSTWRWVVHPDQYCRALEAAATWRAGQPAFQASPDFFPGYRASVSL